MSISPDLIEDFQKKDEYAVRKVYETYFRLMKHIAFSILPSDSEAEDVVQEAFLKSVENADTYRRGTNFTAWICTITKNLALNRKRELTRQVTLDETYEEHPEEGKEKNDPLYQSYLLKQIRALLSPEEYEIFILRIYHELSFQDIALLSGDSRSAVTNKYHRALKKIRKDLRL